LKAEVIADPKRTFERHFGPNLPDSSSIFIPEEDRNTLRFSIPPVPATINEPPDEEFDYDDGGTDLFITGALVSSGVWAAPTVGATVGKAAGW